MCEGLPKTAEGESQQICEPLEESEIYSERVNIYSLNGRDKSIT